MADVRVQLNQAGLARVASLAADAVEREVAPQVAETARRNAPVDTGNLRDSIDVERQEDRVLVVARSEHAIYPELGTSRMPAKPYLRPALYQRRSI